MDFLKNKKFLYYLLITVAIFLIDRATKIYILNIAETNGTVDIYVNSFLNLILVWNTGIGFGLLSIEDNIIYNFITLLIIFINIVIIFLITKSNDFKAYFLLLILGGSFGNLYDRIYYSAVPDFIDLNYNGFHWFVFNIADIFISVGVTCLIFVEIIFDKKQRIK